MRQKGIMGMLLAILCIAIGVLTANLLLLYVRIYRIPEEAVADLCRVLADDGIYLDGELVPRQRENGVIYVSDGIGYEDKAAVLLAESEIRNTYHIPDGQLFLHYNGDITEFTDSFGFHYRNSTLAGEGQIVHGAEHMPDYSSLTIGAPSMPIDSEAAMAAMEFLDKQDASLGQSVEIETVVTAVHGTADGKVYVQCTRQMAGVEITDNSVVCLVEDGIVTEAAGKWCFMTFGESYKAQLSDITNILFMMKRTLTEAERQTGCTVVAVERCYSLYFFSQNEGFCLIPCWRVETEAGGVLVYSALDGTLYTKMGEITMG